MIASAESFDHFKFFVCGQLCSRWWVENIITQIMVEVIHEGGKEKCWKGNVMIRLILSVLLARPLDKFETLVLCAAWSHVLVIQNLTRPKSGK